MIMRIIVNDANILIDLISLKIIDLFLSLDYEFHTNDFIVNEISDKEQKVKLQQLVSEKKILVYQSKPEDMAAIFSLQTGNLSFEDCSIWYYCQRVGGLLLTGDARLRKEIEKVKSFEVRGILYVFDLLIEHEVISKEFAIKKLKELYQINKRLPVNEIEKRINRWLKSP